MQMQGWKITKGLNQLTLVDVEHLCKQRKTESEKKNYCYTGN